MFKNVHIHIHRKWNIVNDDSNPNCSVGNEIIYDTEILKSNICHYIDTYILVRCDIFVVADNLNQCLLKILQHSLRVSQHLMEQE